MGGKKVFLFYFLFVILFSNFVSSAGLENPLNDKLSGVNDLKDKVDNVSQTIDDQRWDYIGGELKKIVLKNKVIAFFDSSFKKIDFLFVFLFAEHYDLSLVLFFNICFWIFFFMNFKTIFGCYSSFSSGVSLTLAFAIAVLSAQIGIYAKSADLLFKFIFYSEGMWTWIRFAIVAGAIVLITVLNGIGGKMAKANKLAAEKAQASSDRKSLKRVANVGNKFLNRLSGK